MKKNWGPGIGFSIITFLTIPAFLVINNQNELSGFSRYLAFFGTLCLASVIFTCILSTVLPDRIRAGWSRILLFLALYFFLREAIAPLDMGELVTGTETPKEPVIHILLEIGLMAALAFLAIKITARVAIQMGWAIAAFGLLLIGGKCLEIEKKTPDQTLSAQVKATTTFHGNIYHITFDAFMGGSFPALIHELNLENQFDSFLFFRNTRSNFTATKGSVASFSTGSIYEEGTSMDHWLKSRQERSITKQLNDFGFVSHNYATAKVTRMTEAHFQHFGNPDILPMMIDLWVLRLVPVSLRQEVYRNGSGITHTTGQGIYHIISYNQFKELLETEKSRPATGQYVYAHWYFPHAPFVYDRYGNVDKPTDYYEQSLFAVKLMAEIINHLKAVGRFDNSLIIFQSDHGDVPKSSTNPSFKNQLFRILSDDNSAEIKNADLFGKTLEYLDLRTQALLVVKLPKMASGPLQTASELTQIKNVPKLILTAIETKDFHDSTRTRQLINLMKEKQTHLFANWRQWKDRKKGGPVISIEQKKKNAELNHYLIDDQKRIHVLPNLRVTK